MTVPDDLRRELDANPRARDAFAALNSTNRYAILFGIQDAKKPETRARRIAKFVAMLNEGEAAPVTRVAALLQGVNLGGSAGPMPELRKQLEELGYEDVATYVASGTSS